MSYPYDHEPFTSRDIVRGVFMFLGALVLLAAVIAAGAYGLI